ncbi:hypothetical protein [Parvularcula marina]|uniref:hypothetical protein n=1 Tax=Parvularcula marina TaxID=2292771 RepID=UPI00351980E9
MFRKFLPFMLALGLGIGFATADEDPVLSAMARLAPLEGEFVITGVRHTPDGPIELREATSTSQFVLNGRVLEEERTSDLGLEELITLKTQMSYDQYRQLYRVAVVDDTWGLMDIYEGRFTEPEMLEVTNLRSDTHFPLGDDQKMHFRLRWDLGAPKTFTVDYSLDQGESWATYFEEVMTPAE